jgi:hypothetical protein
MGQISNIKSQRNSAQPELKDTATFKSPPLAVEKAIRAAMDIGVCLCSSTNKSRGMILAQRQTGDAKLLAAGFGWPFPMSVTTTQMARVFVTPYRKVKQLTGRVGKGMVNIPDGCAKDHPSCWWRQG